MRDEMQIDNSTSFSEMTASELLEKAKNGDSEALEELFRRQIPYLRAIARGRLPSAARRYKSTNDVVQDAFLSFMAVIDSFRGNEEGALRAYLRQIVRNSTADDYRANAIREFEEFQSLDHPAAEAALDRAMTSQSISRYFEALPKLSTKDRFIVVARLQLELSYAEIGDQISMSADAVRMRSTRALRRLAQLMSHSD